MTMTMTKTPGNRRWLRMSLRTLLVGLTCVAVACAWFAHYVRQRRTAFAEIREAGGDIRMRVGTPSQLERWFGPEAFGRVHSVDLREGKADNTLLKHIALLKETSILDLSNADIDDEGLRTIADLPLHELWLQETRITDASAETLSKIQTLSFLQLNATELSDKFLERLEPLPKLRDLGLRGTKVTSVGLKYLARHPQLGRVDVYSTEVDDTGVEHLVDCQSLTDIGLSMTKVTNHVFELLDRLPNLTEVDLSANRSISTEAVLQFERSHPKCDIEWYGS